MSNGGAAKAIAKDSNMVTRIVTLENLVGELEDVTANLEAKLGPVMHPACPAEEKTAGDVAEESSFAYRLRCLADRHSGAISRFVDIVSRLEV